MNLTTPLLQAGFSEKEAAIYLALLELQEALPSSIARRAGIKRPTTYVILGQLEKRGVVARVKKRNNLYYQPINPRLIVEEQQRKQNLLEKALPELIDLHTRHGTVPQMSVFEGRDGLIKVMEDTLSGRDEEILGWVDIDIAFSLLEEYYPNYISKKMERNIDVRAIFNYSKLALHFKKMGGIEGRDIYLIPREKFPFQNEIIIYQNRIAILSHTDQVGVIIENKLMADTQRSIFELGFEYAKLIEEKTLTKRDRDYLKS